MQKEIKNQIVKGEQPTHNNKKHMGGYGNRKRLREAQEDEAWWNNEIREPKPEQLKIKLPT